MERILTRHEVAELVTSWFEGNFEPQVHSPSAQDSPEEKLMKTALMDILNVSVP